MEQDAGKIDTEFRLALDLDEKVREKSNDLNVGFDERSGEWELIIRYIRSLSDVAKEIPITYTELLNGYAVIRINQEYINELSNHPNIIWIEKPNTMITEIFTAMRISCIPRVKVNPLNLSGEGITIAIIDSGADIFRSEFRNADGSTKIAGFWDQSAQGDPPEGYNMGHYYTEEEINLLLNEYGDNPPENLVRSFDRSGHGTAVAGIAASVADKSKLLIVKLAEQRRNSFPRTTELMEGIDFSIKYSINNETPVAINLSFGNNYGDHASNSILETYIDSISISARATLITGTGNDGASGRHAQGLLGNTSYVVHEFMVSDFETGINIQVWRNYSDIVDIFLITPSNKEIGPFNNYSDTMRFDTGNDLIAVINGMPSPFNVMQETFISIIPDNTYIEAGLWKIRLNPKSITDGRYNIWLPVSGSTSGNVYFLRPGEFTTLTIPSTAKRIISVSAYNQLNDSYAAFSGRGYTADNNIKPDIAAPGVDILVPSVGTGFELRSGTSMAAPFVTGSAALMMEWGIIRGNDIYMYGEKVKANLIRGARSLPAFSSYPNPYVGWGALCLADSLPD